MKTLTFSAVRAHQSSSSTVLSFAAKAADVLRIEGQQTVVERERLRCGRERALDDLGWKQEAYAVGRHPEPAVEQSGGRCPTVRR